MNWAPRSIQHLSIFWLCTNCPVKTGLVSAPLISSIALATARFSVSWFVRMRVGTQKCLQASIKFSGTVLLWLLFAHFKNTTTLQYLYPYVWQVANVQVYGLSKCLNASNTDSGRSIATNSGHGYGGGGRFKWGPFCIVSTKVVQKSLMLLHHVNNIEHNLKQNIYTCMEVISLTLPWYWI